MASMIVKLLIVQGKPTDNDLVFSSGEYYIGRGPECQIRLNSELVSRQHCVMRISDDAAFIRDLRSRNGTLLNGTLVDGECSLNVGDQVQVGPVTFEVQFDLLPTTVETVNKEGDTTAQIDPETPEHLEPEADLERTREIPTVPIQTN